MGGYFGTVNRLEGSLLLPLTVCVQRWFADLAAVRQLMVLMHPLSFPLLPCHMQRWSADLAVFQVAYGPDAPSPPLHTTCSVGLLTWLPTRRPRGTAAPTRSPRETTSFCSTGECAVDFQGGSELVRAGPGVDLRIWMPATLVRVRWADILLQVSMSRVLSLS